MRTLKLAALSLAFVTSTYPAFAQENKGNKAPEAPPMEQAMMEAWEKAATPGEHHKLLARGAGRWTTSQKMWMMPGQPPTESTGTMQGEMIMGGRYLQANFKATMMGQPFEGRSIEAYDNVTKEIVSTWVDNFGTGIMVSRGKCDDPACKTVTMVSEMADPMGGPNVKIKQVTTWLDNDSYRFEMWMSDPKGESFKSMEMVAKRQK